MADNQSWESKKDEVWKRIVELEGSVKSLSAGLNDVKALAESRVSVDEKLANEAAKKAIDGSKKVQESVNLIQSLSGDIERLKATLPDVSTKASELAEFHKNGANDREVCTTIVKELNDLRAKLTGVLDSAKKQADEVGAKATIVEHHAQGTKELKDQVSGDAVFVRTCKEEVNGLKTELETSKGAFDDIVADAQDKLTALHDGKQKGLDALIQGKTEELDALRKEKENSLNSVLERCAKGNERFLADRKIRFDKVFAKAQKDFAELREKIETLLPGASSAGLAYAFRERSVRLQPTKWFWISGLVVSISVLLIFGFVTLKGFVSGKSWAAEFAGRSMVVVALILAEEFCRRNYNIAARLTEAYAYKEVLAKSYVGYKKEMASMPMPKVTGSDPTNMGDSVLMSTLLDKLSEAPGDDVFDKERQVIGIGSVVDALQRKNNDGTSVGSASGGNQESGGSINAQLPAGKFAAKVTWPVVVFAGVVVVAICVLLCFFITYGVIGGNDCLNGEHNPRIIPAVQAHIGNGAMIGTGIEKTLSVGEKPNN